MQSHFFYDVTLGGSRAKGVCTATGIEPSWPREMENWLQVEHRRGHARASNAI